MATEVGLHELTHETRIFARMSAVNPIQMWKEASWRPNLGHEVMDELRQSVTHCLNIVASGGECILCKPFCTPTQTCTHATQQNAFFSWSVSLQCGLVWALSLCLAVCFYVALSRYVDCACPSRARLQEQHATVCSSYQRLRTSHGSNPSALTARCD